MAARTDAVRAILLSTGGGRQHAERTLTLVEAIAGFGGT